MSAVIEGLAKHLQERVNKAEPEVDRLRERLEQIEQQRDEALALLHIFGREHTHAEIAPRAAFARAARMTQPAGENITPLIDELRHVVRPGGVNNVSPDRVAYLVDLCGRALRALEGRP